MCSHQSPWILMCPQQIPYLVATILSSRRHASLTRGHTLICYRDGFHLNDNVKDLLLKYLITLENISAHHLKAIVSVCVAHEILWCSCHKIRLHIFCYLFKLYLYVSKKTSIHSLIHVKPLPEPDSDWGLFYGWEFFLLVSQERVQSSDCWGFISNIIQSLAYNVQYKAL